MRSAMLQLGRRLLVAAMILSATGAILLWGEGTSAQSGAPQTITPVRSTTTTLSVKAPTPTPQIAEPPSRAALTTPDSGAVPSVAAPTTAKTIAGPTSKAKPTSSSPSKSRPTSSPAVVSTAAGTAAKSTSAAPSVYQFVGYRDLAPVINPQRAARGWGDVTTTIAKTYAACIGSNSGSCAGHVVPCDAPPTGIGTPSTKTISNGQYKDQYGNCLEFMLI